MAFDSEGWSPSLGSLGYKKGQGAARGPFSKAEVSATPCLGIMADQVRMDDVFRLFAAYGHQLGEVKLVATGSPGLTIRETGLNVECLPPENEGGAVLVAQRVLRRQFSALLILRDVYGIYQTDANIEAMLMLCNAQELPVATNIATAEILLLFLAEADSDL